MINKISIVLQVVILLFLGFITYRFFRLEQQVNQLEEQTQREAVKITPSNPDNSTVANPAGVSPFDKPNEDPLGDQFPPNSPTPPPLTTIAFDKTEHQFGRINEGDKVNTTFRFTNTGKNPLIISSAVGSCGCTVPRWSKAPVAPGQSGRIDVEFDSSGKTGEQTKTVTISANTKPAVTELVIQSTVIPKDK